MRLPARPLFTAALALLTTHALAAPPVQTPASSGPGPAPATTAAQPTGEKPAAANPPSADKPLPYVALIPLAPDKDVPAGKKHLGDMLALLLEHAVVHGGAMNVVTHGGQAEMLDELGVKPGAPIDEAIAKKLAQLSGASSVLFGTYSVAKDGKLTAQVRHFGVLEGTSHDEGALTGTPQEVLTQLGDTLAKEAGGQALPPPAFPASDKVQKGYVLCAGHGAVVLERTALKGRAVKTPGNVTQGCKDATSDKTFTLAKGAQLAVAVLGGDKGKAAELQAYVDTNPDRLAALSLIRNLFNQEKFDEASALLKKLRTQRPRDPDVLRMEGELEIQKDNWEAARFSFQQAVNQAPNSPYLRYRLSYASYRTDKNQDALDHARAALRLSGGDAAFYQLNLAERLLDAKDLEEAVLQLERAVKANPDRLTPRVRLGYTYLLQGDADRALEHLTAAEKLKASDKEKERGVDVLLKLDLARAYALKASFKDSLKYLNQLQKAGQLEKDDLRHKEFDAMRENADFKKLKGI